MPKPNAEIKFDAGPANETSMLSRLGLLKFAAFTGTGLPHPKWATIKQIVPIKSRWAIGFNVNRPCNFAVESPNLLAVQAWENSCMVIANKIAGAKTRILCKSTIQVS